MAVLHRIYCIIIDKSLLLENYLKYSVFKKCYVIKTVQSLHNTTFGVHRNGPCLISESCYKGIILQRNSRLGLFPNSFVNSMVKKWEPLGDRVISKSLLWDKP